MSDCGIGLAPKIPYAACFRTPRCHLYAPNWKVDPHRVYFCNKWSHFAPELCPEVEDPCKSIHKPLQSLDHFSFPPMYRRHMCEPKFRYHKHTFVSLSKPSARNAAFFLNRHFPVKLFHTDCILQEPDPCAGNCRLSCSCCPGIPQLPKCYRPKAKPYVSSISKHNSKSSNNS